MCKCGNVEYEAVGTPILSVICYCDDCQEAAHRIEALLGAPPVLSKDGGIFYQLYRKDRFRCVRGQSFLHDMRLRETSRTKRVIAHCCNSALFLDFEKGHWLSVYSARFVEVPPPAQMHIQTKFKPQDMQCPNDVPVYATFPFRFVMKLIMTRIAMLLGR